MSNELVAAIVIAVIGAVSGILPYVRPRRDTSKEIAEAAAVLVDPLRIRLDDLTRENGELREQMRIMMNKNNYVEDLEGVNSTLNEKVMQLSARVETLERMNRELIDMIRDYVEDPKNKSKVLRAIHDMEEQL